MLMFTRYVARRQVDNYTFGQEIFGFEELAVLTQVIIEPFVSIQAVIFVPSFLVCIVVIVCKKRRRKM